MVLPDPRHADIVRPEEFEHPPHERGPQERHVARGQVGRFDGITQRRQPGRQPLERTAALFLVAHHRDLAGQRRQILARGRDHDDRPDRLAQQAHDAREHQLITEGQPRFRPPHTLALPATQHDPADVAHAVYYRTGRMPW
jgi:hypothetical protein